MYALSAGRTESCLLDEKPVRLAVYRPHLAAAEDNPIISFCGPMSVEGGNAMKKKMNDSGKSKLVLTILTALCVVLIILSFTTDAVSGPLHYVTGVITPIQSGMNAIGTWISDKGEYLFHTDRKSVV